MAGLKYMPVRSSSDSPGTRSSLSSLPEALVMAVSWLVQNHAMAPVPVPTRDCSGPPASTSTVLAASGCAATGLQVERVLPPVGERLLVVPELAVLGVEGLTALAGEDREAGLVEAVVLRAVDGPAGLGGDLVGDVDVVLPRPGGVVGHLDARGREGGGVGDDRVRVDAGGHAVEGVVDGAGLRARSRRSSRCRGPAR